MIVIDANVAVKWILPEAGSEAAVALQEGPDRLVAPGLIRLEVSAAITRRVRAQKESKRLSPEEALGRCRRWSQLLEEPVLSLIPEAELLDQAVKLSVHIKHTLQDCMYLAAAIGLDAPLVTADKPFQERAERYYKRVSLLRGCDVN